MRLPSLRCAGVGVLVAAAALSAAGVARADGRLCVEAVSAAAAEHVAPTALLQAMALVESGRGAGGARAPWPWTINHAGRSMYFDTKAEAIDFARGALARGDTNFDIGCMQVNHHWHAPAFATLEEMFEPRANASYAVRFLTELKEETGDWMQAVGFYHSRTPSYSERYRGRVIAELNGLSQHLAGPATAEPDAFEAPPLTVAAATSARPTALHPLRPSVWRGLLRQAAGALLRPSAGAAPADPAPSRGLAVAAAQPTPRAPQEAPRPSAGALALTLLSRGWTQPPQTR